MRAMVVALRASRACSVRVECLVAVWWVVVVRRARRVRKVRAAVAKSSVSRMPGGWSSGVGAVVVVWGVVVMAWWAAGVGVWFAGPVPCPVPVAVVVAGWVIMAIMRAAAAMVRAW